jgi:hypothetical protein
LATDRSGNPILSPSGQSRRDTPETYQQVITREQAQKENAVLREELDRWRAGAGQTTRPGASTMGEQAMDPRLVGGGPNVIEWAQDEPPRPVQPRNYRGDAACESLIIYGAPTADGIRRGKLVIEQVPDRSLLRARIVGFDPSSNRKASAEIAIDAEAYEAIKKAFSGYGNEKIDAPKKLSADDYAAELVNTIGDVMSRSDISAPMRQALARGLAAIDAAARGELETGTAANGARRRMDLADDEKPDPNAQFFSGSNQGGQDNQRRADPPGIDRADRADVAAANGNPPDLEI